LSRSRKYPEMKERPREKAREGVVTAEIAQRGSGKHFSFEGQRSPISKGIKKHREMR